MSLTVTNYTHTGTKKDTTKLAKSIFAVPVNESLLAQALRVYSSNQRQCTKSVQTRADVARSTAKIWRQKGTGRARHGSRKAPIFVGGGQAHGPSGIENYTLKLSKQMRRRALLGALTVKQENNQIITLEDVDKIEPKTKAVAKLLKAINASDTKVLLILDKPYANVLKAIANLPHISATQATRLNVYELLNHTQLVISKSSLAQLESCYVRSTSKLKKQISTKGKSER